jgi:hypothetical protein
MNARGVALGTALSAFAFSAVLASACANKEPPPPQTASASASASGDGGTISIRGDVPLGMADASTTNQLSGAESAGQMFGPEDNGKTIDVPLSAYSSVGFSDGADTATMATTCKAVKTDKKLGQPVDESMIGLTWHLTTEHVGKHAVVIECTHNKTKKKKRTSVTIVVRKGDPSKPGDAPPTVAAPVEPPPPSPAP